MITPDSALRFDLFALTSRKRKIGEVGELLQERAKHIDFAELATLTKTFIERSGGRKSRCPASFAEVIVRMLALKRLPIQPAE